jgi:hypothetical protein
MTMFVFVGPTLRPEEVSSAAPGAVCLPPVAQGDVYRAFRQGAHAIGIIDGYFSGAPSVWHKEILWALAEGIQIFGSASMGALRAAELHTFGMRGVGRIFEAYRDGVFEDDDEVAVVHGPAETDFMVASEPMVNIRATLARAEADGVILRATRYRLEAAGKSLFFPHRSWPAVLRVVGGGSCESELELATFEKWLPGGAVDQKRDDALEMLVAMQDAAADQTPSAGFRFERTHFWDDLVARAAMPGPQEEPADRFSEGIIDELRLLGPDVYAGAKCSALLRMLADSEASRRGAPLSDEVKRATATELRQALGLLSRSQLDDWIEASDLDDRSYARLVESEAQQRQAAAEADRQLLDRYLLDELRLSGQYRQLADRARDKAGRLGDGAAASGLINPAQLRAWYFESRLDRPIPEDIGSFAQSLGFSTTTELDRALQQEFVYARLAGLGLGNSHQEVGEDPVG